ncbi:hypothetical protein SISNIDRAFT_485279 [Sistotremastrum niveocremeum HHB9708]|uniref:Uncharacterized protein n=2 Tax=Sistotremastraceae TaxID=3402574 RepID=A0A164UZ64_9AGAM|nr:hypothetical protein SISNIDRAFT_485279 [Sistotremastrum niveocremeum HHB9708]KZT37824.1 hypothetical protein SISSUDRAFT_1062491 [Sistotremastrum suecicum HHB10207 ss-3]
MQPNHSFENLVDVIRVSAQSTIGRVSRGALELFAVDVTLVALGIRSGCLIDTFSPRVEEMNLLVQILKSKSTHFEYLLLLTDDTSNYFIVNSRLLAARVEFELSESDPSPWTSFILLDEDISSQSRPSPAVINHLQAIISKDDPLLIPPTSLGTEDAISLAGFLLEYPFSYRPSDLSTDSNPLGGIPLLVYECSLISRDPSTPRHSLMKFSCPLQLIIDVPSCASDIIQSRLVSRFRPRLLGSPIPLPWTDINVTITPITLNHVAL